MSIMHGPLAVLALASAAGTASALNLATALNLHRRFEVKFEPMGLPAVPTDAGDFKRRNKVKARKLAHSDICVDASDYDGSAPLSVSGDCVGDCNPNYSALTGVATCDANNCWTCDGYLSVVGYDGLSPGWSQPYAECEAGENMAWDDEAEKYTQTDHTRMMSYYCCGDGAGICDGDDDYLGEGCGIGHYLRADCDCTSDDEMDCSKDTTLTEEQIDCVAKARCEGYSDAVLVFWLVLVGILLCCVGICAGSMVAVYVVCIKGKSRQVAIVEAHEAPAATATAAGGAAVVVTAVPVKQVQSAAVYESS
jgi:hypothetical protein